MSIISKFFRIKDNEFNEVRIDKELIDSVIYYSKKAYPNEFLAFLDGEIKDKILYITSLIFIPGDTSNTGAVLHMDLLPPTSNYWGSVHSHPGPSAEPSEADLATFSKNGIFHMILCLPYSAETFKAYNKYGELVSYTIGDYSNEIDEDDISEFYDEDMVLKENEKLDLGFFHEGNDLDEDDKSNLDEIKK